MRENNRSPVIPLIGAFLAVTAFLTQGRAQPSDISRKQEAIRQLNEQLLHAYDVADVATLGRTESDDFTLSGDFGIFNKQQHLHHVRTRGPYSFTVNPKIENQQSRFYGDVALLTEVD